MNKSDAMMEWYAETEHVANTLVTRFWRAVKGWALAPARASDEALLDATLRGDEAAFDELAGRYELELYRYCLGYLQDAEQSRVLAREVLSRIRSRAVSFESSHGFKPWFFGIAQACCIRAILRERAQERRTIRNIA